MSKISRKRRVFIIKLKKKRREKIKKLKEKYRLLESQEEREKILEKLFKIDPNYPLEEFLKGI